MPIKVHDKRTGEIVEVDGAMAQQGLADGSLALADDRVKITRAGEIGSVSSDDVAQALGQGFRIVDQGEADKIKLLKEETDTFSTFQAGAEAALSGATLGLSDMAATGLGADRERMALRREGLGSAGTALEIAGSLAPLLISGGTAAPAVGARGVGGLALRGLAAPVRTVEALGAGAEALTARGLMAAGAAPGGLLRSVVPIGVRGATEGLAYGMGAEISEASLGGREITAERLMASGGMGALLGGAAGGAFGGLGRAAIGGAKIPGEAMSRVLARMADGTVDSTHPIAKALGGIWGMSPDDVARGWRKFKSGEMGDYFYRAEEKADEIRGAVLNDVNGFSSSLDDAIRMTSGERKMRRIESMIPESSDARAPWRLRDDLDDLNAKLQSAIEENRVAQGGAYEHAALKEAQAVLGKATADIGKAKTGVEAFRIAERAKQQLGSYSRTLQEMQRRAPTPKMQASLDLLEGPGGIGSTFREFMTDERLFGTAAAAQREIAAADSMALGLVRRHSKGGGPVGKIMRGEQIDSRDAMLFVKRWARAGSESLEEATDSVYQAQISALRKRQQHYDLTPEENAAIEKAVKHYDGLKTSMEKQRQHVDTYDLAQRFRQAEGQGSPSITAMSTLGPAVAGTLGSFAGPLGAAAGYVVGSITRPYTMLRTLSGLHDIASKAGVRIDEAVQRFVGGFGQKVKTTATRTLPEPRQSIGAPRKVAIQGGLAAMSTDERDKHLDAVRTNAARFAESPAALQDALADLTYEIDQAAPGVAASLMQVTQRGAAYLAANAPKAYHQPFTGKPPVVSRVEASAFARRVEATVHPLETLEQRLADRTLTSEHVDAFEQVWPELFDGVRKSIGDAVVQAQVSGTPIPMNDRAFLGRLYRVPIGPGADVTLATSMAVYGQPPQQQQQGPQGQRPRQAKIEPSRYYTTAGSRAEGGLRD